MRDWKSSMHEAGGADECMMKGLRAEVYNSHTVIRWDGIEQVPDCRRFFCGVLSGDDGEFLRILAHGLFRASFCLFLLRITQTDHKVCVP